MNISKAILLFTCFINSLVFADFDPSKYQYYVTQIENWNYQGNSWSKLYLSNNTKWSLSDKSFQKGQLAIPSGTEIFIETNLLAESHRESYYLKYHTSNETSSFYAGLDDLQNLPLLTLVARNEICIKEGGWFSSAEYINVWQLSDDSKWILKSDRSGYYDRYKWNIGDHVIVSISPDYKSWILINTDQYKFYKTPQAFLDHDLFTKKICTEQLNIAIEPYLNQ